MIPCGECESNHRAFTLLWRQSALTTRIVVFFLQFPLANTVKRDEMRSLPVVATDGLIRGYGNSKFLNNLPIAAYGMTPALQTMLKGGTYEVPHRIARFPFRLPSWESQPRLHPQRTHLSCLLRLRRRIPLFARVDVDRAQDSSAAHSGIRSGGAAHITFKGVDRCSMRNSLRTCE